MNQSFCSYRFLSFSQNNLTLGSGIFVTITGFKIILCYISINANCEMNWATLVICSWGEKYKLHVVFQYIFSFWINMLVVKQLGKF